MDWKVDLNFGLKFEVNYVFLLPLSHLFIKFRPKKKKKEKGGNSRQSGIDNKFLKQSR